MAPVNGISVAGMLDFAVYMDPTTETLFAYTLTKAWLQAFRINMADRQGKVGQQIAADPLWKVTVPFAQPESLCCGMSPESSRWKQINHIADTGPSASFFRLPMFGLDLARIRKEYPKSKNDKERLPTRTAKTEKQTKEQESQEPRGGREPPGK